MLEMAADAGCDLALLSGADILLIRDAACSRAVDAGAALRRAEARLVAIEREALARANLVPGAAALLSELRGRGIPIGVVTRNCREIALASLEQFELPYDALVARADTPRVKPHPDHLLQALRLLEASPSAAVMVGDGRMDVEAGRAAGLLTAGYLAPGRPEEYFASPGTRETSVPDRVIRHLSELIPWIFPSSL